MHSPVLFADALAAVLREARLQDALVSLPLDAAGGRVLGRDLAGVRRGALLTAARVAACAAAGETEALVFQPPRFALLAIADGRVEPGAAAPSGCARDIHLSALRTLIEHHTGREAGPIFAEARVPAAPEELRFMLREVADLDMVVTTGRTSEGPSDLAPSVIREFGEVVFHGAAVEPGGTLLLARLRQRTPRPQALLGLPGTPWGCLMAAQVFLVPMVRAMSRLPVTGPRTVRARVEAPVEGIPDRLRLAPVRLEGRSAVPLEAGAVPGDADGWLEIPAGSGGISGGSEAEVRLFD